MNTVNCFQYHRLRFQHHRLRKRGKLGYNDDEDRDRHVTTVFHLKQFGNPQNASMNVAGMMTGADKTSSMLDAIENDAAQVESSGADITSLANGIAASNAELAAAKTVREKEATDCSKSEAELVEVADTLKRAISELSERMRVISLPCHRRDTIFVVRDHGSHQEA